MSNEQKTKGSAEGVSVKINREQVFFVLRILSILIGFGLLLLLILGVILPRVHETQAQGLTTQFVLLSGGSESILLTAGEGETPDFPQIFRQEDGRIIVKTQVVMYRRIFDILIQFDPLWQLTGLLPINDIFPPGLDIVRQDDGLPRFSLPPGAGPGLFALYRTIDEARNQAQKIVEGMQL